MHMASNEEHSTLNKTTPQEEKERMEDNRNHYWLRIVEIIYKEDYEVFKTVNEEGKRGAFYHYTERGWKGGIGADDDTVEFSVGLFSYPLKGDEEYLIEIVAIATDRVSSHDGEMDVYYNHVQILDSIDISIRGYREKSERQSVCN